MEKVVILARVSTDKQEYERQITELAEHCRKMGWEVVRIFANKVSGAKTNEEREEIQELIEFVTTHQIQRVVCLEISRMGRNTLEALKVIQLLNEHKVSLYVKNYNLETLDSEGKVNPVASLICTILLEIAQMERLTIKERMASGRKQYIEKCRREGIKMGRPESYRKSIEEYKKQYQKEISLIRKGLSLANISAITGTSINTVRKVRILVREGRL
ncbi:MAG: recombinase family protein [Alistipes sp.]|nr:recombinase family protein [Alistipes sp.]